MYEVKEAKGRKGKKEESRKIWGEKKGTVAQLR